jgi:hypothetical protein
LQPNLTPFASARPRAVRSIMRRRSSFAATPRSENSQPMSWQTAWRRTCLREAGASLRRRRVENFFCILKAFRRIAMRYDKTDESFAAMIHLVGS